MSPEADARLVAAIRRQQAAPFCWGAWDCVTFWRDCVEAITGRNPIDGVAPWSGPFSARRTLLLAGCRSVEDYVAQRFAPVRPADLRRGDLAYPAGKAGPLMSPAVVLGSDMISRGIERWVVLPIDCADRGWRVA